MGLIELVARAARLVSRPGSASAGILPAAPARLHVCVPARSAGASPKSSADPRAAERQRRRRPAVAARAAAPDRRRRNARRNKGSRGWTACRRNGNRARPGWPIGHLQIRSLRSSRLVLSAISGLGLAGTRRRGGAGGIGACWSPGPWRTKPPGPTERILDCGAGRGAAGRRARRQRRGRRVARARRRAARGSAAGGAGFAPSARGAALARPWPASWPSPRSA